jgi:hypothetical protein
VSLRASTSRGYAAHVQSHLVPYLGGIPLAAFTPVEALAGLADVVRDVLADLGASGEPIPGPLSERTYPGRFVVRVPAEVHRRLVREAANSM